MLRQFDLASEEEHLVALGRQVIPLVGVSNLESGDLLGDADAPLMIVPLDAVHHGGRPSGLSSGPPGVTYLCRHDCTSRSGVRTGLALAGPA